MPDTSAKNNEFKEGITRLPQPVTTRETNGWRPAALGFNALTKGQGLNPVEMKNQSLRDVREGRTRYAALSVRREMAATILAAGGTTGQAARAIGARSRKTINRYLRDPHFRDRVAELQSIAAQQVGGRIMKEFRRRTTPENIERLEVLDLTRIFDRVMAQSPSARDAKAKEEEDRDVDEYHATLQQIILVDARSEGEDFPTFTDEDLRLSGGDTPE